MQTIRYAVLPFGPPPVVAAICLARNGRPIAQLVEGYDREEVSWLIQVANLGQAEWDRRTDGTGEHPLTGVDLR